VTESLGARGCEKDRRPKIVQATGTKQGKSLKWERLGARKKEQKVGGAKS
jgi:hypothetical protein